MARGHTHVDGSFSYPDADPPLWGYYVRGMDEWHAAASRLDAMRCANALNVAIASREPRERDPHVWSIPDLWPFSGADHASELTKQATETVVQ